MLFPAQWIIAQITVSVMGFEWVTSEISRCRSNASLGVVLLYWSLNFRAVEFVDAIFDQPQQVPFLPFHAQAFFVYSFLLSIFLNHLPVAFYSFPTFPIPLARCP